jgi:hypothetical protein
VTAGNGDRPSNNEGSRDASDLGDQFALTPFGVSHDGDAGRHASLSGTSLPSALETSQPGQSPFLAVRLRRGTRLPNRRIVGETDRVVHLARATGAQAEVMTFCGMRFVAAQIEQVPFPTGMPCEPCMIASSDDIHANGVNRSRTPAREPALGAPPVPRHD